MRGFKMHLRADESSLVQPHDIKIKSNMTKN